MQWRGDEKLSEEQQDAQIALLEYYSSLMNGYKTYILTLVIGILTVVEVWFRIPRPNHGFWVNHFMAFCLGFIFAGIVIFNWRFYWCGEVVRSIVYKEGTAIRRVEIGIKKAAGFKPKEDERRKQNRALVRLNNSWKWLLDLIDNKVLLVIIWLVLALGFSEWIFCYAPMFGLGPHP
jgi:hypothetical protein